MTETVLPESAAAATRHWLETAVIGLNLCPFAGAVYRHNLLRLEVAASRHLDDFLEKLDGELLRLADTPAEELETTLLIETRLFDDFEVFNQMLDIADHVLLEHGLDGVIQIAPFHPQFQFDGTEADAVGNNTNRSPYPTLHLIREASIERAMRSFPNADSIFERNIALLEKMGADGWAKLWQHAPAPENKS